MGLMQMKIITFNWESGTCKCIDWLCGNVGYQISRHEHFNRYIYLVVETIELFLRGQQVWFFPNNYFLLSLQVNLLGQEARNFFTEGGRFFALA